MTEAAKVLDIIIDATAPRLRGTKADKADRLPAEIFAEAEETANAVVNALNEAGYVIRRGLDRSHAPRSSRPSEPALTRGLEFNVFEPSGR